MMAAVVLSNGKTLTISNELTDLNTGQRWTVQTIDYLQETKDGRRAVRLVLTANDTPYLKDYIEEK